MTPGQDAAEATVAPVIAVIIPCYRAAATIGQVLAGIGSQIDLVYCVDDGSRDGTAEAILRAKARDGRIRLIVRAENGGVGAATVDGYRAAIAEGATVLVKLDADGQMDPAFAGDFAAPVIAGEADYVKGNRFFDVDTIRAMPFTRIVGNAGLSFLTKLSTGYWDLFDPTNGYTALHADVAAVLPLERLHKGYFFESDLLFRLGVLRARILQLPLAAQYGTERSHLSELKCLLTFPILHLRNIFKRTVYTYFLRGFSLASINLVLGFLLVAFATAFGVSHWIASERTGVPATAGTVMLSALPLLLGVQLLLSFLSHDIAMTPREPIHRRIARHRVLSPMLAARRQAAAQPAPGEAAAAPGPTGVASA